jgi:hypothetical protein
MKILQRKYAKYYNATYKSASQTPDPEACPHEGMPGKTAMRAVHGIFVYRYITSVTIHAS